MSDYKAPVTDIAFVLDEHVGMAGIAALPGLEEATPDVVQAVLEGVATLTEEVIAPLNWPGDRQGTRIEHRAVVQAEPLARFEHLEIVDADTLQPLTTIHDRAVAVTAVWFGQVRLIDNRLLAAGRPA